MSKIKNNPLNQSALFKKDEVAETEEDKGTNKKGLPEEWIRATFIVREDLLNKLKDLAYTNRTTHKEELDNALEEYLKDKKPMQRPE